MFGTNDLIYVPEGEALEFHDVQQWRRVRIDTRKIGLRIRPGAFDDVAVRMRGAAALLAKAPKKGADSELQSQRMEKMLADLALHGGQVQETYFGAFASDIGYPRASWWVRISDGPAESFHQDDYEQSVPHPLGATPYLTYGTVAIASLDDLLVDLAEDEEEGLPFALDVPAGALLVEPMAPAEPLPLVREFCGVHGVSAFGRTVNVEASGNIPTTHQFCTPLGRIGDGLFVTLYVYTEQVVQGAVVEPVGRSMIPAVQRVLETSRFEMVGEGSLWRIFQRGGDVVHLYLGLEGKEAEGHDEIPGLVVVAQAAGQRDPLHRSELLEAIVGLARGKA